MSNRTKVNVGADTLPSPGFGEGGRSTQGMGSGSFPSSAARSDATSSGDIPGCLGNDEILQYRQGELSPLQLDIVDAHLDACPKCREIVDLVIADDPEGSGHPSQLTTFNRGFVVAGRYEIERFMGKGGMGEVYAAIDQLTGKRVALKTVLCTATDDARAVRRLFDEVLNAQRVAHPHVFKIYDLHEHRDEMLGSVPFFTMEFIDGESLGTRIRKRGALPISEVEVIARQLLSGLGAAHAKGVLHLDFKSDNVLLRRGTDQPDAVIMDFGLSRASDVESRQRTSERLQGAGTLPYMSLEQLECQPNLGPTSDVYSFGVVLYEMLTGILPFRGDSFSAVLLKQLRERPVEPSQFVPGLSTAVDGFVLRCLARAGSDRPPDATAALEIVESVATWQRPRAPSARRHRVALMAMAVLLVGAASFSLRGTGSGRLAPSKPVTRFNTLKESVDVLPAPPIEPAPAVEISDPTLVNMKQQAPPPAVSMPPPGARTAPKTMGEASKAASEPSKIPPHAVDAGTNPATGSQWQGPPPKRIPTPLPL